MSEPHRKPDLHHTLQIDTRIGPLHLHANIAFSAPWTVIFGPSGSGKSSLLRAICGLIPSRSLVCHYPTDSASPATDLTQTPTHRRNLAYAPQGGILFPHLTVRQNIAFAASVQSQPNDTHAQALLDLFRLGPLADRFPRDLSGGERQRVALARAFAVPAPHLILLDEPFTGLDRPLRDQLLPALAAHLAARSIPVLSVTHDVEEALLLNAEVIRLHDGRITAQGPAHEVLAPERTQILQAFTRQ